MKQLKLTVIIPTRERLNTLVWSIKTLTEQNYDNLEIIVSDNFSQDGTGDYVKKLEDTRIKYVNTGKRISMTENWEFALSYATGDYVTFIGDDDGMALGALNKCNEILNETNSKALVWKRASYIWGGDLANHQAKDLSNTVLLPDRTEVMRLNAKEELREILCFKKYTELQIPPYMLPCLYIGFIRKDVLDLAKEKQGGQFFHSRAPDIYSSMLLPFFIDDYIYSFVPYGVNGTSVNSNSGTTLVTLQKGHMKEAKEFQRFLVEAATSVIQVHSRLRFCDYANFTFCMMDSYLHVCDSLKIEPEFFDIQRFAAEAIAYVKRFSPETLPWTIQSLEETFKINGTTYNKTNAKKDTDTLTDNFSKKTRIVRKFLSDTLKSNKKAYVLYLRNYRKKDIFILDKSYPANILGACRLVGEKLNDRNWV